MSLLNITQKNVFSLLKYNVSSLLKYADGISRHVHHSHHQDSPQKNPNESGAHEFLVTRYIPYHDNDRVDHSQLAHSLLNDVFPRSYHKPS